MIIIGDLHQRNEKTQKHIEYLFKWIDNTFDMKNETLVLLGDIFDKSLLPSENLYFLMKILKQYKKVVIITGNHDTSFIHKNYLLPFLHLDNIILVEEEPKELMIDNIKCFFLPYKKNMKNYEELCGEYDYIFCHAYFKENDFGNEGVKFNENLKGIKVAGHDHTHKVVSEDKIVLGTPFPSRFGENLNPSFKIMQINNVDKSYKLIDCPKIFTYLEIDYDESGEVKCDYPFFELYVKNAPSRRLAKKIYKNYDLYKKIDIKTDIYNSSYDIEINANNNFDKKIGFYDYLMEFLKVNEKSVGVVEILKNLFKK